MRRVGKVSVTICLIILGFSDIVENQILDPVLFTNNKLYALQNQHAGNYLTAGTDGKPYRTQDRGSHTEEQLWRVKAINKEGFELVPNNNSPGSNSIWKPIYLGYGKYRLKNIETGNCLEATSMTRVETPCNKENLSQEWFPTLVKEKQ